MPEPTKNVAKAAAEPIIELVETVPVVYIVAALVVGALIGVALLLVYDDHLAKSLANDEPSE